MWALRIILLLIVVAIALGFSTYNAKEYVGNIDVIWVQYQNVSLVMIVYWSFLAGMSVAGVFSLTYLFRLYGSLRRERRSRRRLETEVASLRNRTIEELDEL